jgi:hypothetical protein
MRLIDGNPDLFGACTDEQKEIYETFSLIKRVAEQQIARDLLRKEICREFDEIENSDDRPRQ